MHDASCPGEGSTGGEAYSHIGLCAEQYTAGSIDKAFVAKVPMAMKEVLGEEEKWNPVEKRRNPCSSPLVESYLTGVSITQKHGGVPV